MQNPFEDRTRGDDGWIRWRAPAPGAGWSPLPVPGDGTVTEHDLFLLRILWDLTPEGGSAVVALPHHEVQEKYAEESELPRRRLEPGVVLEGETPIRGGPAALLVGAQGFGNVVDLFTFANRDEAGVAVAFVTYDDAAAMGRGVDRLAGEEADLDAVPGEEARAWGILRTGGADRAGLWIRPGTLAPQAIEDYLHALGERMQQEAARLEASEDPRASRRLLATLLG